MIVQNFSALARTPKRKAALSIINAGIEAVLTKNVIKKNIALKGDILSIMGKNYKLDSFRRVYVIGFGKAALASGKEIEKILGKRIYKGIVLDVTPGKLKRIKTCLCTHPVLSEQNVRNTKELIALLRTATDKDLVLCCISGGGSAILENPAVPLNDFVAMNKALLHAGEDIHAMNTVRKHLSLVKGGQLPTYANGATFVSLIFSDVIGDDLSVIASGATVLDKTTKSQAQKIVSKYKLPKIEFRETPKKIQGNVHNILLLTNKTAVEAMKKQAVRLDFKPIILSVALKGEARDVGAKLAKMSKKGVAIIAAGETTVTVKGHGKGGRNQEVGLGALKSIGEAVVASAGTDGIDNTPAAGSIVDKSTLAKLPDYKKYLAENNAFVALTKSKDLIMTGKTGTNVADIMVAIK